MPDKFKEFLVSDLAHADVFNDKVYKPGEENRKKLDQHLADEANPHEVTWSQTGASPSPHGNAHHNPAFAQCPHGNECHDPDFLPASQAYVHPPTVQCNAITGAIDTKIIVHGNEWHDPPFLTAADLPVPEDWNMEIHGNEYHNPLMATMSMSDKTFWINGSGGSDANSGLSKATAWKTWNKVLLNLPQFITHDYKIMIVGGLSEDITIEGRVIRGNIEIRGETTFAPGQVINGNVRITSNVGGYGSSISGILIRYLRTNGQIIVNGSAVAIGNCQILSTNSNGAVILQHNASAFITNCWFGVATVRVGVRGYADTYAFLEENSGSAVDYGYRVSASMFYTRGTMLTGGIANTFASTGGEVRS